MKRNPRLQLEILLAVLAALCAALLALLVFAEPLLLIPAGLALVLILVLAAFGARRLRRRVARYLGGEISAPGGIQASLAAMPLPTLVLQGGALLWCNPRFEEAIGPGSLLAPVQQLLPGLDLTAAARPEGQDLTIGERRFNAYASGASEKSGVWVVFLVELTELRATAAEYAASRPAYMLLEVDGYDILFNGMKDSEKARLMEGVNRTLEQYFGQTSGFLRRLSAGRYVAVVEERHMQQMVAGKFSLLDQIRALDDSQTITLSAGVGRGGATLAECQEMAQQSLDMALGRGGDQVAVKTRDGFEFYGGVSRSIEKRSKVKNRILATALADMIHQSDSVIIMGHKMSDLDCVGAAIGVLRICKIMDVPAIIAVRSGATLAGPLLRRFRDAGFGDDFTEPEDVLDTITKDTLLVVVDTYLTHLLESREIYERCRHVAVIDHHRKTMGYIENPVVLCHEPYASSASELVSEMLQYVGTREDKPTPLEAEALLAGIMLDTRNFALHTGVRTFEAAAYLRQMGAQTEEVKRLFASSMEEYAAKASLVENAVIHKGCAISVCGPLAPGLAVVVPQAANDLLGIEGVAASFVAVEKNGGVNISARSMGEVNVQVIMESLGGGGHLTMAGAQLKDCSAQRARELLISAVDAFRADQEKKAKK
ncbi:DHH family phosphoesterase [Gemmiger formicilis]|uniref:DHH family phosphoesterase n=1 Tax=Gemmiger formicilis TaxID=745368 RepID=UPI00195C3755|nr:DHH family phosphoesterase [Gemmiger formicilis]MBM6914481.1 DHH family phosphoesterase [Gemmiger formicilis]